MAQGGRRDQWKEQAGGRRFGLVRLAPHQPPAPGAVHCGCGPNGDRTFFRDMLADIGDSGHGGHPLSLVGISPNQNPYSVRQEPGQTCRFSSPRKSCNYGGAETCLGPDSSQVPQPGGQARGHVAPTSEPRRKPDDGIATDPFHIAVRLPRYCRRTANDAPQMPPAISLSAAARLLRCRDYYTVRAVQPNLLLSFRVMKTDRR